MTAIDCLPVEILSRILRHVQFYPPLFVDLKNCILTCRLWHEVATPLLYQHVALHASGVSSLLETFNPSRAGLIRSLTIRLRTARRNRHVRQFASVDDVFRNIKELSTILGTLTRLSSLSLYIGDYFPRTSSHEVIACLLDALPPSCIGLEIHAPAQNNTNPDVHLCDRLRLILPRMQHVRLKLKCVCSALFGEGLTVPTLPIEPESGNEEDFKPISLPNIQTLMVNFLGGLGGQERCDTHDLRLRIRCRQLRRMSAWDSVVEGLKRLVEAGGAPPSSKLFACRVLDQAYGPNRHHFQSFALVEMRTQTTLVMPFYGGLVGSDLWEAHRVPGGGEFIVPLNQGEDTIEGRLWLDTNDGSRLPAPILAAREHDLLFASPLAKTLPPLTVEAWREQNPGADCLQWVQERLEGMERVNGEKREGPDEYLSLKPLLDGQILPLVGYESLPGMYRNPG
ncbi:hypothetical protein FQN49_001975 [Arthroderma sp. PD_2]|nr:hypothetical protein FQN49_001975 [Arthroderma sp. PD_2]